MCESLVRGDDRRTVAAHPVGAKLRRQGLAERPCGAADLRFAGGRLDLERDVEARPLSEQLEQVIEDGDAGIDLRLARAGDVHAHARPTLTGRRHRGGAYSRKYLAKIG